MRAPDYPDDLALSRFRPWRPTADERLEMEEEMLRADLYQTEEEAMREPLTRAIYEQGADHPSVGR